VVVRLLWKYWDNLNQSLVKSPLGSVSCSNQFNFHFRWCRQFLSNGRFLDLCCVQW